MNAGRADHWDDVYSRKRVDEVSWFEPEPSVSLRLVTEAAGPRAAVIDVGAGASTLVDALLRRGHADLAVLDVSRAALGVARDRLGRDAGRVAFVAADVLEWTPDRRWDVWHDRAVFHFLVAPEQRGRYARTAAAAVAPGGALVIGTFAPDGPERCSGLPVARHDAASIADALAPAFVLERSERHEHRTPGGTVQPFTWAVLRRESAG